MAGIYLHIPFCKQACNYCNFHFSTSLKYKDELLHAMHLELQQQLPLLQAPVETIYFGGGTPSLLSADDINKLTETIDSLSDISHLKEYTIEVNPDDITENYLHGLQSTLVNRFSMGVQSFHDADLQWMNRAHRAQQADYAIKAAQDQGFTNITIDLIFGAPSLSDSRWEENLAIMQAYDIPHFSAYALTVEEGTLLHHQIQKQKSHAPPEEKIADQFRLMQAFIEANHWDHYEISNIAKPGFEAVHNTNYWKNIPYLGIGPSAHSYDGKQRWWNVSNNALYIKGMINGVPDCSYETLTTTEKINERILTRVRTKWGLNVQSIANDFGEHYAQQIKDQSQKHIDLQHLSHQKTSDDWGVLLLTHSGKLYADGIASDLFVQ